MNINQERFWAKVDKRGPDDCWPWTGAMTSSSGNYGTFWEGLGGRTGKLHRATKVSLYLETGKLPEQGEYVLHSCDNPPCVNPGHLRIGTPKDNAADAKLRNRHRPVRQQENPSAKLTAEQVHEIRTVWRMGIGCKKLTRIYGIESRSLRKILNGISWVSRAANPSVPVLVPE